MGRWWDFLSCLFLRMNLLALAIGEQDRVKYTFVLKEIRGKSGGIAYKNEDVVNETRSYHSLNSHFSLFANLNLDNMYSILLTAKAHNRVGRFLFERLSRSRVFAVIPNSGFLLQ